MLLDSKQCLKEETGHAEYCKRAPGRCAYRKASGLEYISSAGLRVLLSTQKTMNRQGSMKLIGVNETIMEIFSITGFCDILTIE